MKSLNEHYIIDNKYFTQFLLKSGEFITIYRVKDKHNVNYLLKLYDLEKLHKENFDEYGNIYEIEIVKNLSHPNIEVFVDSGNTIINDKNYLYLVFKYISGESLAEYLSRTKNIDLYDILSFTMQILEGLSYLHNLSRPILHNSINMDNIIIDESSKVPSIKIVNFHYARYSNFLGNGINLDDLNLLFVSNEGLNGKFSIQNDIYSVGAILYNLIYRIPPWFIDVSKLSSQEKIEAIIRERMKPLLLINDILCNNIHYKSILNIINKALNPNFDDSYKDVYNFIEDLKKEFNSISSYDFKGGVVYEDNRLTFDNLTNKEKGFSAIAGMKELKEILTTNVINLLKDPEGAKEYGLTIPNGMLLFGPPGCGKTYISEKLAEEVNFNYYFIKSSDLVSPYAFETQKKIGKLFDDAYKNKPSIICFDEFDSYAFRKDMSNNAIMTGVVNEILTQLNNCGKRGVFVIATTNNPELIEKSILRKGRMDLLIYVPPPDYEARKELFKLYLKDKPKDFNINYDELANLTDKYVASDIEFIAIDAAREAYKFKTNITQKILINIIGRTRSSLSDEDNKKYDFYKDFFDGSTINTNYRKPIGFRINKDD